MSGPSAAIMTPASDYRRLVFGLMTILLGPLSVLAAEQGDTLQPKHIAKLRFVVQAAISPDGQTVAYTLGVPRQPLVDDDGGAWTELHVVDLDGQTRPFITGKVNVGSIQWSPDGRNIYYLARRQDDAHSALYRIPIDGGESQRVVTHDTSIQAFAIAEDGRRIAFLATADADDDQKEERKQGFDQEIYEEDARPTHVWLTERDSDDAPRRLELEGSASDVRWSPSGRELMVVLAPTPLVDDGYMFRRVHLVDVDSGHITRTVPNVGKLGQVEWSPDGQRLAMVNSVDEHDPHEGRMGVIDVASGSEIRDLMPDYQAHVASFAWADDQSLIWVADEGTGSRVGKVDLNGTRTTFVSTGGPILGDLSLAEQNGTVGLVGHRPEHPPEVYTLDTQSGELTRLTTANPWLDSIRLARQESVTYQARDDLEIEGVLIYPLNYVEGRRYPLIMAVHGGPESREPNGWLTSYSRPGQVAAARGFAVFYPNYRGSTGRGVEFSKLGQADAAGKEFDDIVDAIDHLAELGLVDKQRVGITGGSYGGYASAWGATYYSDRYAASVMFVGISDNVSKVGTTDIPEEMFLVHHLKRLWDDWDYFLQRSPIRYVQRNRTPTLILHGKNDPRVHPSQSLELFRHLKTLKQAPVRLVLYEGEGHGNRKAAARLDYHLRMLRWMEHYLQGPGGEAPDWEIDYQEALKE